MRGVQGCGVVGFGWVSHGLSFALRGCVWGWLVGSGEGKGREGQKCTVLDVLGVILSVERER